mgnify:CR=1 FL=1
MNILVRKDGATYYTIVIQAKLEKEEKMVLLQTGEKNLKAEVDIKRGKKKAAARVAVSAPAWSIRRHLLGL